MIGFNRWFKYSRKHDYFKNGELAGLEDKYRDESSMYHFVGLLLEALKDKLLHIERNGTVYDIPIYNIEDIYYQILRIFLVYWELSPPLIMNIAKIKYGQSIKGHLELMPVI